LGPTSKGREEGREGQEGGEKGKGEEEGEVGKVRGQATKYFGLEPP